MANQILIFLVSDLQRQSTHFDCCCCIQFHSVEPAHTPTGEDIWAAICVSQQCGMCDQQMLRPACAYAQSDQSIAYCLKILRMLSQLKRGLHMLVWVYTCQNATLLAITCHGSYTFFLSKGLLVYPSSIGQDLISKNDLNSYLCDYIVQLLGQCLATPPTGSYLR